MHLNRSEKRNVNVNTQSCPAHLAEPVEHVQFLHTSLLGEYLGCLNQPRNHSYGPTHQNGPKRGANNHTKNTRSERYS